MITYILLRCCHSAIVCVCMSATGDIHVHDEIALLFGDVVEYVTQKMAGHGSQLHSDHPMFTIYISIDFIEMFTSGYNAV